MKSELKPRLLQNLTKAYPSYLKPNPEYQRGLTWTSAQRQGLIDSILRGYQLPIFYIHLEKNINPITETVETTSWIVDGQQRLAAIVDFCNNKFSLPDPSKAKSGTFVPMELNRIPSWAGKKFNDLELDDRDKILNHELLVVEVTADKNDVRELFIRLQGGTPLTAQEKRDAWPGDFTNFVIRNAGKQGHDFSNPMPYFEQFKKSGGGRTNIADGEHYVDGWAERRKFFAGLAMTLMLRERSDLDFVDIKGKTINDFYIDNLDLRPGDVRTERVLNVLKLVSSLPNFDNLKQGIPMTFQMAFHFTLLVDSLNQGNYKATWKQEIVAAFVDFKEAIVAARKHYKDTRESLPHYESFARLLSGSGSDTAETIRIRHSFLLSEIYSKITVITLDQDRRFGPLEREVIWNRDRGCCQNPGCLLPGKRVSFHHAEIHHIIEHSAGGSTTLKNGILICNQCHGNRKEMQDLTDHFTKYIERTYSRAIRSFSDESINDLQLESDAITGARGNLIITINWGALNVDRPVQNISKKSDADTIVEMLRLLLAEFGKQIEEQLRSNPVIRFPLSTNPTIDFWNNSQGKPFGHIQIPGTSLYFCPQSDRNEKVKRLRFLFSQLKLPDADDFPEDGLTVTIGEE